MNFIIKIVNQIIIFINKLIDKIDKKTTDLIRNIFFGLVFLMAILAILIGYNNGKKAAKRYGKPLAENTNYVLDITIKKEHDKGIFRSMLDSELLEESKLIQPKKNEFPANEKIKGEFDSGIIDIDNNKNPSMNLKDEKVADIDRIDDKLKKGDVNELKKAVPRIKPDKSDKEIKPLDNELKIIEK